MLLPQSVVFWKNIHPQSSMLINSEKNSLIRFIESVIVYCLGLPVLLYGIVHVSYGLIKR